VSYVLKKIALQKVKKLERSIQFTTRKKDFDQLGGVKNENFRERLRMICTQTVHEKKVTYQISLHEMTLKSR